MEYPSNVQPYNLFRFLSLNTIDLNQVDFCLLEYPREYGKLLFGAMSLLSEVNMLTDNAGLSQQEMVDIYNNHVRCFMDLCDEIADCIANNTNVQNEISNVVNNISAPPGGEASINSVAVGSLDCVWGGAVSVANYVIDNCITTAETIEAGLNALTAIFDKFPALTTVTVKTAVDFVNETALPLYITQHNDPDYRLDRACDLFCSVIATAQDPANPSLSDFNAWIDGLFLDPLMFATAQGIGQGFMQKLWILGQDECDNDWLLCDCVNNSVVAVSSNGDIESLVLTAGNWFVSWSGIVTIQVVTDFFADGVFIDTGGGWFVGSARLEYRIGASGDWQAFSPVPDERSEVGYTYTVVIPPGGGTLQIRFFDTNYSDNSGTFNVNVLDS